MVDVPHVLLGHGKALLDLAVYPNEKVFPIHSPSVTQIEVARRGDVRQAKLGYIRGQVGKKAKVGTKIGGKDALYREVVDTEVTPAAENPVEEISNEGEGNEPEAKEEENKE